MPHDVPQHHVPRYTHGLMILNLGDMQNNASVFAVFRNNVDPIVRGGMRIDNNLAFCQPLLVDICISQIPKICKIAFPVFLHVYLAALLATFLDPTQIYVGTCNREDCIATFYSRAYIITAHFFVALLAVVLLLGMSIVVGSFVDDNCRDWCALCRREAIVGNVDLHVNFFVYKSITRLCLTLALLSAFVFLVRLFKCATDYSAPCLYYQTCLGDFFNSTQSLTCYFCLAMIANAFFTRFVAFKFRTLKYVVAMVCSRLT